MMLPVRRKRAAKLVDRLDVEIAKETIFAQDKARRRKATIANLNEMHATKQKLECAMQDGLGNIPSDDLEDAVKVLRMHTDRVGHRKDCKVRPLLGSGTCMSAFAFMSMGTA